MSSRKRLYIIGGSILAIGLVVFLTIVVSIPRNDDWEPKYELNRDRPLDLSLLPDYLREVHHAKVHLDTLQDFPWIYTEVDTSDLYLDFSYKSAAWVEPDSVLGPDTSRPMLLVVGQKANAFQPYSYMYVIEEGVDVFACAARDYRTALFDSLGVYCYKAGKYARFHIVSRPDERSVLIDSLYVPMFMEFDADSLWQVLATIDGKPCIARRAYKYGYFYVCSTPALLSNACLLDSATYPAAVATAEILARPRMYIPSAVHEEDASDHSRNSNMFGWLGGHRGIMAAVWIICGAAVTYIFAAGRSRQRTVPVVAEVTNTTLEFAQNVGSLYFRRHDNANLAYKIIRMTRISLYAHFQLSANASVEEVQRALRLRTSLSNGDIEYIISDMYYMDELTEISNDQLAALYARHQRLHEEMTR